MKTNTYGLNYSDIKPGTQVRIENTHIVRVVSVSSDSWAVIDDYGILRSVVFDALAPIEGAK